MYTKNFYVHEIAAVDLSKFYFLKNAKKTCESNNRDLNQIFLEQAFLIRSKIICSQLIGL